MADKRNQDRPIPGWGAWASVFCIPLIIVLISAPVHAKVTGKSVASLCSKSEQVLFSCRTKGQKLISVCGSLKLSGPAGYVQYRFGKNGHVELEFPKSRKGSERLFNYAHYWRFQTDYKTLSFVHGKANYSVFDNYDGEQKPVESRGVEVKVGSTKDVSISCIGPYRSALQKLEGVVSCDPSDALNMGSCTKH